MRILQIQAQKSNMWNKNHLKNIPAKNAKGAIKEVQSQSQLFFIYKFRCLVMADDSTL